MTKKKRLKSDLTAIILLVAIVVGIFALGYAVGSKHTRIAEYEKNKVAIVHTVSYGETLWDIAEKYKPSHIYILEYLCEIEQNNNITNAEIYPGDKITVYTTVSHYTLQGYYADGVFYTYDGNEWEYSTSLKGDAIAIFNDNGTPENIYDDIIINIMEV